MSKEIVGYEFKPEFREYADVAAQIAGFKTNPNDTLAFERWMKTKTNPWKFGRLDHAGVLDLWFNPIYGTTSIGEFEEVTLYSPDDMKVFSEWIIDQVWDKLYAGGKSTEQLLKQWTDERPI